MQEDSKKAYRTIVYINTLITLIQKKKECSLLICQIVTKLSLFLLDYNNL